MTEDDLSKMEPLKLVDRCDRCGAQAWVRVGIGNNDLLFCSHHFADAEAKITPLAAYIHDERTTLREGETKAATLA